MSHANAALIVVDAQESFRRRSYFRADHLGPYVERQQALVDGAKRLGVPVVQVFHVEETGVFAESSGFVVTLSPLQIAPDAIFKKRRHSALVGSGLDVWLISHGVGGWSYRAFAPNNAARRRRATPPTSASPSISFPRRR